MNLRNLFVGLLIAALTVIVGCSKPKIDVVNGRPMVSNTMADIQATLDQLAKMPAHQRANYMHQRHPDLAQRIVEFLRKRGKIQSGVDVQRVDFFFGSLNQVKAEDAIGRNEGYLKNQLVARVYVFGQRVSVDVIVRCLNGIFELPENLASTGMNDLGGQVPEQRFTIGRNDNLVRHVGYLTAVDLAERHNLPLFRGKGKDRRAITPIEARRLESETDRVQVVAMVYEGDRFDLIAGTYTSAPKSSPVKRVKSRRR